MKEDPRQLSLFSVSAPAPAPKKVPPEVQVLEWLSKQAPLIHVWGDNLCKVDTFRSYDRPRWVHRKWMNGELDRYGYKKTHTLTTAKGDVYDVYQPFQKGVL